ncbi:MAG: class II glutamine amidotransferase [Nitrososphaerota archaeon]|nr:class II glutamine amidotransferase [Candidatus Bathyarchaeota archaeon]MDW8048844.1 class II glutamine amidotransferase [Nitrososphaerota archaeon]
MCRLLGMFSITPTSAAKYLVEDPCSLYVQSMCDKERLQSDGWGIGYYTESGICLHVSEKPVYEETEKFFKTAANAISRIIIAHVRRASNPRELPRHMLISKENSQPFRFENYLFAHNGTITIPDEVAENLGEWKCRVRGVNDSEIYFWYIIKEMKNGASFAEALTKFENDLSDIWNRNRHKYPNKERPFIGLNTVFSDGQNLYAYCRYHEIDVKNRSICFGDQPSLQMSYLNLGELVVIASEKTNREKWDNLRSGELLTATVEGGEVKVAIQSIT